MYKSTSTSESPQAFGGWSGATDANSLGIGQGGTEAYAVQRAGQNGISSIFTYSSTSGAWDSVSLDDITQKPAVGGGFEWFQRDVIVAGAVNKSNGHFVFGGFDDTNKSDDRSNTVFRIYDYDPVNKVLTYAGYFQTNDQYEYYQNNGDIAFDTEGNLYVVRSNSNSGSVNIFTVTQDALQTAISGAQAQGGAPSTDISATELLDGNTGSFRGINGIAVDSTGYIWLGNATEARLYNPNGWAEVNPNQHRTLSSSADLASCSQSPTFQRLQKDVVGRVGDTDQFKLTITEQGAANPAASGQTQGTDTGLQTGDSEVAGPVIVQSGKTYILEEVGATDTEGVANANLANYTSTLACFDENNSKIDVTPFREGSTTKYTLTIAQGQSPQITCTFTNTPKVGSVAWTKHDDQGKLLGGSEWKISGPTGDSSTDRTVTDNTGQSGYSGLDEDPDAGQFLVTKNAAVDDPYTLPLGDYTLTETKAPGGYAIGDRSAHDFTLTEADPSYVFEKAFTNTRAIGSVTWTKTASDGTTKLGGSTWTLTPTNPGGAAVTVEDNTGQTGYSGKDEDPAAGAFKVSNLGWGTYELKETEAPVGYDLPDPIPTKSVVIDGSHLNVDAGNFADPQKPAVELPRTGGSGNAPYIAGGLGVLAAAAGLAYLLARRRKAAAASAHIAEGKEGH